MIRTLTATVSGHKSRQGAIPDPSWNVLVYTVEFWIADAIVNSENSTHTFSAGARVRHSGRVRFECPATCGREIFRTFLL